MRTIAIIGGGAAGMGAARALAGKDVRVLLLEAEGRLGGRAWTVRSEGMPLDLGCGYLHSADRNPWVEIAREVGLKVDRRPPRWQQQYRNLGFAPEEQRAARAAFDAFAQRLYRDPPRSDRAGDLLDPDGRWTPYIEALSGYINGAEFGSVSVADYLAYDAAATDENWRVREGYGALVVAGLPAGIEVRLNTPVTTIDHRDRRLRLETPRGILEADAAIVTVSTAVLANGGLRFRPELPAKREAAAALPLGLADKCFLALADGHGIDPNTHLIGNPHDAMTGSYQLLPLGRPVIEGFFGGMAARALESEGAAGMMASAINEMAALLGSDIRKYARPLVASGWGQLSSFGGSYSHALPGRAAERARLAEPVDDRLFFAGEACSENDFSTAHGALASGVAAAVRVLQAFSDGGGRPR